MINLERQLNDWIEPVIRRTTMLEGWEKIAKVLDRHQPSWAIDWADQRDLQELARGQLGIEGLKRRVVNDLFHPILNAALEARLIMDTKSVQDTLDTEETGIDLLEVARNAKLAELKLASISKVLESNVDWAETLKEIEKIIT